MRPTFARQHKRGLSSFTLVEMLVVIFIIAILAALALAAGQGAMKSAARSRARVEIQAVSAALENYKTDNGTYPLTNVFAAGQAGYKSVDGSSSGLYQEGSQLVYESLSGKTNFLDTPVAGVSSYMAFKANQLGNVSTPAGTAIGNSSTYVQDPFSFSYGYNTGDTASPQAFPPFNGTGSFDLWSTGGVLASQVSGNPLLTNSWVTNWTQ